MKKSLILLVGCATLISSCTELPKIAHDYDRILKQRKEANKEIDNEFRLISTYERSQYIWSYQGVKDNSSR